MRPEGGAARPLTVVGGLLLLTVLAASVAGPWEFEDRDLPSGPVLEELERPEEAVGEPELGPFGPAAGERRGVWELGWVVALVQVLTAGLVLLVVVWLWRRFRRTAGHQDQLRHHAQEGVSPVDAPEPELPVLAQGVSRAQSHLDTERDPTEKVVAAWLALEEAAAGAGIRRNPADTPTEFTVAVLDRTDADRGATRRLLTLYQRARFSDLPTSPTDVEAARACLRALTAGWHQDTVVPPEQQ